MGLNDQVKMRQVEISELGFHGANLVYSVTCPVLVNEEDGEPLVAIVPYQDYLLMREACEALKETEAAGIQTINAAFNRLGEAAAALRGKEFPHV
jgi:hypothetical protein